MVYNGKICRCNFYPRPPRGGRQRRKNMWITLVLFLSTSSARRTTMQVTTKDGYIEFLSTSSARRTTSSRAQRSRRWEISIHVLREEDDGSERSQARRKCRFLSTSSARRTTAHTAGKSAHAANISIHVLREEDDSRLRQATFRTLISIHVLREEDDPSPVVCSGDILYFYPRPPRGGRPAGCFP